MHMYSKENIKNSKSNNEKGDDKQLIDGEIQDTFQFLRVLIISHILSKHGTWSFLFLILVSIVERWHGRHFYDRP